MAVTLIDQFVIELNLRLGGPNAYFSYWSDAAGPEHTRICMKAGNEKYAYCFVDRDGNIYQAADAQRPAKGVRANLGTLLADWRDIDEWGVWLIFRAPVTTTLDMSDETLRALNPELDERNFAILRERAREYASQKQAQVGDFALTHKAETLRLCHCWGTKLLTSSLHENGPLLPRHRRPLYGFIRGHRSTDLSIASRGCR
jgi:hypothetical protein